MNAVTEIAPLVGIVMACVMLAVARATYYRSLRPRALPTSRGRRHLERLGPGERQAVLDVLHEPRFADQAPAEVYATLLDEGRYLCSERTMYRILAANHEVRERRDQLRHPDYTTPELLATRAQPAVELGHHQAARPARSGPTSTCTSSSTSSAATSSAGWSRTAESAALAEKLIAETCARQGIAPGQLTLHADRGSSMTSQAGRVPARRPRRHQDALAAARLQRQPVLRGAVQDAQVPARLPRALRLIAARPRPLRRLLRLVQQRAPPRRHSAC